MARSGRPKAVLVLSEDERDQLVRWSRRAKSSQAVALRSRIVLRCADGVPNKEVAAELRVTEGTVGKWRRRFVADRLDGLLLDEPRPGRPPVISVEQVEAVVVATLEETPKDATHWSRSKMASRSGLSKSTIGRIWKAFDLKPHRADTFKLSSDPLFVEKVYDVVGLYIDPPESAILLCVDELGPPAPRCGVQEVPGQDRHRSSRTPGRAPGLRQLRHPQDPRGQRLAGRHPRFHMHFTPTGSSWINQVERWFAYLTEDLIRRGSHTSVQTLEADVRGWVRTWNDDPKPFIWTKTAEQILDSIGRLIPRINGAGR